MTYRFLSPALVEVSAAAEFYEAQVPGFGADFIDELDAAIGLILRFPTAWAQLSGEYRHRSLRRFPYSIVYCLEGDDRVLIVSVFHQRREPLSWRCNLQGANERP
jgi:plasmid stabilization system protein ParE